MWGESRGCFSEAGLKYSHVGSDVTHAGIYQDSSIAKSAINALTIEIERHQALAQASKVEGPFESAQNQFHCGQQLAREASASEEGLAILPLLNTDRKGGAFLIIHSQFKRAIGVAIAWGNATHKLARKATLCTKYELKNLLHIRQK
eukprot:scaffold239_cov62-Cyclotella_meneghiniana.AAC.1